MYRTNNLYDLLFQGIPDSLRNELWLIFSGAVYDVSPIDKDERMSTQWYLIFRKQLMKKRTKDVFMNPD